MTVARDEKSMAWIALKNHTWSLLYSFGKLCDWSDLSRDLGVTNTFVSGHSALTNPFVEFS